MAISSSGRSALLDRPQLPPHSSARTERPPFFWLKPAQAHLLRQHSWLPLKRTRCVNTAGLPVALPRVARFLLAPHVVLPRVARFLLAPPVVLPRVARFLLAPKRFWLREKRWLTGSLAGRYCLREKRWLLGSLAKRF